MRVLMRAALVVLSAGCAAPDAELHLAPFFSRHTVPGYDHAEAAAGILRYGEQGDTVTWALSPLVWRRKHADGTVLADFAYPLGRYEYDPHRPRTYARLFPIFWREAETRSDGVEDVDWTFLPPLFWGGSTSDGLEDYFAFFPVMGTLKNFLTYDEVRFFLFPLMLWNKKEDRESHHLLWPFFGWQEGSETGWRIFPLYGKAEVPGKYKRSFVLWPLIQWGDEELDKKHERHGWLVVPLAGRIRQDDYTATTALWPIFGWADRPSTEYESWQVWPILKFESGGRDSGRERAQFLPLWMRFEDENSAYTSLLFPLFWWREDRFGDEEQTSFFAVPFYWQQQTKRADGSFEEIRRFWPIARRESSTTGAEWTQVVAPGLEPLLDSRALSRNLGFTFELWSVKSDGGQAPREKRAFLNLYHEAESAGHKRWSVPFLGGQWTEPDGTVHTSILLGLLRWRTGDNGGLEEPAFPGPGWPDLHEVEVAPAGGASGAEEPQP